MKFVLAFHGTRGDIEPCAAIALELLRRGHEVRLAVPPNLVAFVESAGVSAVPYGPDSHEQITAAADFVGGASKVDNLKQVLHASDLLTEGWSEMSRTLVGLTADADLLLTSQVYHGVAANVAEYRGIPVAALHYFPFRVNGQLGVPSVPLPQALVRSSMRALWWLYRRLTKSAEDAQRRQLNLPRTNKCAGQRMLEDHVLEIQAYDEVCFPGLAAEWVGRWPFVGSLTLELGTDADERVLQWIAAGEPPIYFGFGSMPVQSPKEMVQMISAACEELGERALISLRPSDLTDMPPSADVMVVGAVNHSAVFGACRAVVHHGGAGTTAAGMRAGIPTLIFWVTAEQPIWAAQVKRLKVGTSQRFSSMTKKSLVSHLRTILTPAYQERARAVAAKMIKPADGVAIAADLLEDEARKSTSTSHSRKPAPDGSNASPKG